MSALTQALAGLGALGTALVAGTFFAFSTFVMPALARLPAAEAVRAMQSINAVILGSPFIPIFVGTAAVAFAAAVSAFASDAPVPARHATALAALVYLFGVLLLTGTRNVPLNDALMASIDPAAAWDAYYEPWMLWNHLRTVSATLSLAALLAALRHSVA